MITRTTRLLICAVFLVPLLLGSCSALQKEQTITILAGSELKDMEPLLAKFERANRVSLKMEYIGTLDGAEKIMAGEKVDFAWFSHAKYLMLLESARNRILAQEKIMLSPVVLGVKESKARAWGWVDNPNVTWQDIANRANSGDLRYAMTNPTSSNSGFSALVGAAAALSGNADALQIQDIEKVTPQLKSFFKGQALTAGSSGWLADQYLREEDHLDGIINYESVLLGLNKNGKLHESLYLIYPKEGIITADYPLMLINGEQREIYNRMVAFLLSAETQKAIMEQTLRRPVITQVSLNQDFPKALLIELPFPSNREIVDRLLFAYLDEQSRPSTAFFVLDISGSMQGDRLTALKEAMNNLAGADASLTGQFSRFRNRERITIITFNDQVQDTRDFEIDLSQSESLQSVSSFVNSLQANGKTGIYSALQHAYDLALAARKNDPGRYYSIVLLTDGENNSGLSRDGFLSYLRSQDPAQTIKTFPILFGEANQGDLQSIADATGGRMFDAKSDPLSLIFKEIRGYQ